MLEIFQCYQTKNRSYEKKKSPITPIGVLVHSTDGTNKTLKRWVDAPERLGKNLYGNHWNSVLATKSVHAFIGYDKDQKIIVANTLPYDRACWGAGKGKKGCANYDPTAYIQFEICQGSNTDAAYYWAVIEVAEEYCAYLCQQFGWSASDITSHVEAHSAGLASNHGDPEKWMKHFGDNMKKFRARVAVRLGEPVQTEVTVHHPVQAETTTSGSVIKMNTVKNGSRGTQVKVLQWLLNDAGYDCGTADGIFGAKTLSAVKAFQKAKDLTPDGVVGAKTWAALLK